MQKQARLFKIDTNSGAFQDIIRCYWIPRLLQKIQESSSSGMFVPPQPLDNAHQQSAAAAAPLLPPPPPLPPAEAIQSLDYNVQSIPEYPTSPFQVSEYPTSPFHDIVNNDYDTFVKGCYFADNNGCEMEDFHLGSMPALGNFENCTTNSHVVANNWAENDFSGSGRNMDGLWQIRN